MFSLKKLLTWLIVLGAIALYPWVAIAWYAFNPGGLVITIPWSIASAVPPLIYALLAIICLPRSPARQRIAGMGVLCALHGLLGILTGAVHSVMKPIPFDEAVAQAFLQVPPSPFLQIIWAPLLLLPFRHRLSTQRRPEPSHAISLLDKSYLRTGPVATTAVEPEWKMPEMGEGIAAPLSSGGQDDKVEAWLASLTATEPPPERLADSDAPELSLANPVLGEEPYVPVERWLQEEPPAGAEQAASGQGLLTSAPSGEGLLDGDWTLIRGEELNSQPATEPLLIDTDRIPSVEQAHADIRIPFERIADQLPAEAFQLPLNRLASCLREPNLLLIPQQLVLSQLSEGAVRVPWSVVAAQFPQHALAISDEEMAQRIPNGGLLLPLDEVVCQLSPEFLHIPLQSVEVHGIERFPEPFEPSSAVLAQAEVSVESVDLAETAPPSVLSRPQQALEPEARSAVESPGSIEIEWSIPEAIGHQVATGLETERLEISTDEAAHRSRRIMEAQRISGLLAPLGSPTVDVEVAGGVTLFVVSSPHLTKDILISAAGRLVPLLVGDHGLPPVEQATLRGSESAIVLTSLAFGDADASVLVTGVRPRGSLALVEALSRRVAAEYRVNNLNRTAASEAVVLHERVVAEFEGVPLSKEVECLAGSLQAFGPVTPSAFRDATDGTLLYLFLAPGTAAQSLGRFARDLHHAMRMNGHPGGLAPFQSAIVRVGRQRIDVRPVADTSGGAGILVVAGNGVGQPGLAHLQAQRAAARLGAH